MLTAAPRAGLSFEAKLFRGLSDPSRLSILEALRNRRMPVGQIAKTTGLSQPNASNHLRCLSDCGLVTSEQEGRFVFYSLSDERIEGILRLASELLAENWRKILECTNYGACRNDD